MQDLLSRWPTIRGSVASAWAQTHGKPRPSRQRHRASCAPSSMIAACLFCRAGLPSVGLYAQVAPSDDLYGPADAAALLSPVRCTLGQGCMHEWNVILATLQTLCLAYPAGCGLAAVTACPCDRSAAWIFFEQGAAEGWQSDCRHPSFRRSEGPKTTVHLGLCPRRGTRDLSPLTLMAVRIGNLAVRVLSGFAVPQNLPGSARVG